MDEAAAIPLPPDNNDERPAQPTLQDVKLPTFWPARPKAWFTYIEGRFRLRNIQDEQTKFDLVLSALPSDIVAQVLDVIEEAPEGGQYVYFKDQLLRSHQLSDYEKFDRLVKMEPMGGRKPSQLLHDMLEFCPAGMDKTLPFHYFFTQRLPLALRTQLGEVKPGDPRELASRADVLWSVHSTGGSIAAVEAAEESGHITAVSGGARGRGGSSRGGQQRGGQRGGRGGARSLQIPAQTMAASQTPAADPSPSDLARMASGLCFYHWTWSDKARKCSPPCSWGN
jgi:hypothetical protein